MTVSTQFHTVCSKMSDKRRRRTGGSDDSEHSDSDGGEEKNGDLDLDKDEGVVSEILCHVWTFELSGAECRNFWQSHGALPPELLLPTLALLKL